MLPPLQQVSLPPPVLPKPLHRILPDPAPMMAPVGCVTSGAWGESCRLRKGRRAHYKDMMGLSPLESQVLFGKSGESSELQFGSITTASEAASPTRGRACALAERSDFLMDHEHFAGDAASLELKPSYVATSLHCSGTLDAGTRHDVVEAVAALLAGEPSTITIDIGELHVADVDGANALAHVQKMARDAGTSLQWEGLDSDHLRGILPLRFRAKRQPHDLRGSRRVVGFSAHPALLPPIS